MPARPLLTLFRLIPALCLAACVGLLAVPNTFAGTATTPTAPTPTTSTAPVTTQPFASPPQQPALGQLGGNGPCRKGATPTGIASMGQQVWLFQPAGTGSPRTGGTCNDRKRPVIVIAHGATAIIPLVYQEMIDNMVSNGYMVVYSNQTLLWYPEITYNQVLTGARYAYNWLDLWTDRRMDVSNLGIWGHSSGGGMVPWLAQQAEINGWGRNSMWLQLNAPYFAFKVGQSGPIHIPAHARMQVVNYEHDDKSDAGIGIDIFESATLPDSQKDHVMVMTDGTYVADHGSMKSWALKTTPSTHLAFYGVWRNYQAMGDCARYRVNCDVDLTYMGTWSDGHEATRAIVTDDPVDIGPPALDTCDYFASWKKHGTPHLCPKQ